MTNYYYNYNCSYNFRQLRLHVAHRCGLLLQMSHVARSVCLCVCVLGKRVSCESTEPCIRWGPYPHRKGHFEGTWAYCNLPTQWALRPPQANVPAQPTQWTNALAAARGDGEWRCGLLRNYFRH